MGVFDARPILLVVGILLITLGISMALPALYDAAVSHPDWRVFLASAIVTTFFGVSLALMNWGSAGTMTLKQAFVLVPAVWLALVAFGAVPFLFSELELSYTDAFFESMSGLTTTGSTVISGLDTAPPGLLLWRSLLQWLGGIGIIVMAVSILPILQVGGMQLFKVEAFDTPEKVLPSAAGLAGSITFVYVAFTVATAFALWIAGMNFFDGINHAMTTIATGGYSTRDASVGFYDNAAIHYVIIFGMIAGSLPFVLYIQAFRGKAKPLLADTQVRVFLGILCVAIVAMVIYQITRGLEGTLEAQVRYAAFNVISIMTGTGYATQNYSAWGPFAIALFFILMFIGGCSGSTSCGLKIFRVQVIFATCLSNLRQMIYPHGIFVPHYNRNAIPQSVSASVMSFFFLYIACFGGLALLLTFTGLEPLTALSSAATSIANVGPGLGPEVGPSANFAGIPDTAKWLMAIGMLIGRLELFTVLILFSRIFWRS
ncbi:TrkH family potassium uptake protein [Pyruvatibacter sp.]|uniref:TrkH family potassium uptake protein n=1 Tax=Pyruvatibacter sp. TaxID=1981328 RepID=UPI0032EAF52F